MNLLLNPACMRQHDHTPPPLGFLYMAAMEKDTEIYDEAIRPRLNLSKRKPRVVGVPVYTRRRHESLDRLRDAKKCGAVTVAGGPHVATMLKQMVKHYGDFIDYFVVGDGELAWKAICEGQSVPRVLRMRVEDLDTLPLPAWNLIDYRQYPKTRSKKHRGNDLSKHPRISVVLGRGCGGRCTFCLPAGTLISLPEGLCANIENVKVGEYIATLSGVGLVQETFHREANELIVLEMESGKVLELTPEHPVLTHNRGWVNAGDLREGDDVVEENL